MVTPGSGRESIIGEGSNRACNVTKTSLIMGGAGRLCKVIVTTVTAVGTISFYDNASGNNNSGDVLFTVPSGAAVGTIYDVQIPVNTGITVVFGTSTGGFTVTYAG